MLNEFAPDLVIYDAGVDVHVLDALGRLDLSDQVRPGPIRGVGGGGGVTPPNDMSAFPCL